MKYKNKYDIGERAIVKRHGFEELFYKIAPHFVDKEVMSRIREFYTR